MSDERNSDTGEFTPAAEPLYGLEGIERDAGYVPYKEEAAAEEPEAALTIAEAAQELTESRTAEGDVRTYTGFSELDDLPDNVTLTIDQAAKITTKEAAAEEAAAEEKRLEQVRQETDA